MSHRLRIVVLGAITVAVGIAVALLPRIPQSLDYHNFADRRTFLTVPNCFNVISNAPFLLAGMWGMLLVLKHLAGALAVYWIFRMLARRRPMAAAEFIA